MALPSKIIELMGQIADTLDNWPNENQKWNNKIIKDKPENLLSEISENLDYILEELQQHMPNIVELVREKKKKLVRGVGRVYYPGMASYNSSRRCIISRDDATALANTLQHIAEMAREDLSVEKQKAKRRLKKKPQESTDIAKRFTFRPGQVLFDGHDLNVRTGTTLDIIKALVDEFGHVVPFQTLDGNSLQKEASEKIRTAIGRLRKSLKSAKIPAVIENRKGEGYRMRPSTK